MIKIIWEHISVHEIRELALCITWIPKHLVTSNVCSWLSSRLGCDCNESIFKLFRQKSWLFNWKYLPIQSINAYFILLLNPLNKLVYLICQLSMWNDGHKWNGRHFYVFWNNMNNPTTVSVSSHLKSCIVFNSIMVEVTF